MLCKNLLPPITSSDSAFDAVPLSNTRHHSLPFHINVNFVSLSLALYFWSELSDLKRFLQKSVSQLPVLCTATLKQFWVTSRITNRKPSLQKKTWVLPKVVWCKAWKWVLAMAAPWLARLLSLYNAEFTFGKNTAKRKGKGKVGPSFLTVHG